MHLQTLRKEENIYHSMRYTVRLRDIVYFFKIVLNIGIPFSEEELSWRITEIYVERIFDIDNIPPQIV
jgi:hypothetical protein